MLNNPERRHAAVKSQTKCLMGVLLPPAGHASPATNPGCLVRAAGTKTTRAWQFPELNEDLYLRRNYLTLFLNGPGYQESKLEL